MKYRISPNRLWYSDGASTQAVAGVEGECYLHYLAEQRAVASFEDVLAHASGSAHKFTFEHRDFSPVLSGICQVLARVVAHQSGGGQQLTT